MVPTARGFVTLVTALVLFGLAWQTRIGWFYVVDAAVWGVLLVNALLPWLNLRGLSARRYAAARSGGGDVFEGNVVELGIEIVNRSLLPKLFLVVQEQCPLAAPGEREADFLVDALGPRGHAGVTYALRAYRRGVYSFDPLRVQSTAPFGLFRARRCLAAPLETTVYPEVLPMGGLPHSGFLQGRNLESGPPRFSGEFRGSREYRRGDRIRSIHWRNSARQGSLMVKEYDHVPEGEAQVAFNPAVEAGRGRETTLEYGVKVAASVARFAAQEGRPFRLWTSARGEAFASWHATLERLARVQPLPEAVDSPVAASLRAPRGTGTSVVVASAADRETMTVLRREGASRRQYMTVIVLTGFAPEREDPSAVDGLARLGLRVVQCGPGGLAGALGRLTESPRGTAARRTPATTPYQEGSTA